MDTLPFIIASKKIKYLGIHLTTEIKYLDDETHKTLMKGNEEDTKKVESHHLSRSRWHQ